MDTDHKPMTEEEAKAYLKWYDEKVAEYHYLAHFPSSRPFAVDYPEAGLKRNLAKVVLGTHEYQHTYEQLLTVYPTLPREKYDATRKKYGIT